MSPPTLVSHLLTHGASPFALTRRKLTALDIVTAHSTVPGREDVALLLEEAMREEGWKGGRMEEQRRLAEKRLRRLGKRKNVQSDIEEVLGISSRWWGDNDPELTFDWLDEEDEEDEDEVTSETCFVSRLSPSKNLLNVKGPYRHHLQTTPRCLSSRLWRCLTSSNPSSLTSNPPYEMQSQRMPCTC